MHALDVCIVDGRIQNKYPYERTSTSLRKGINWFAQIFTKVMVAYFCMHHEIPMPSDYFVQSFLDQGEEKPNCLLIFKANV